MDRQAVQEILHQRSSRSPRRQQTIAVTAAVVLHVLVVTAAFAVPRLTRKAPQPIEYVEVHVLPPEALGVEKPAPRPEAKPPEPEPEEVLPEPEDKPLPKPEPEPETKRPPEPKPEPVPDRAAAADPGREAAAEGSPTGAPAGTSRLGAQALSPDGTAFPYDYYLEQMLGQIRRNWARPPIEGVRTIVTFRVLSDGRITDVSVQQPSGSRSFDLAAVRALRNASPLPPLPASYRQGSLTVNLIVR